MATREARCSHSADAYLGTVLNGRYRICEEIGRGGMGRVYRAEQIALGRDVALKILDAGAQPFLGKEHSHVTNPTTYDKHELAPVLRLASRPGPLERTPPDTQTPSDLAPSTTPRSASDLPLTESEPSVTSEINAEFQRRFFLEASTAAKLQHPNTVRIFDFGCTEDQVHYMAMELLDGETLHAALRREGAFPVSRAFHIAGQVCRSLQEAHDLGLIHRDLKSANIFLTFTGDECDVVKVLDFGLVKDTLAPAEELTQLGVAMGSPKYMAPEQIRGGSVDHRADIYGLGVMLYEMLCGRVPFDAPDPLHILMGHLHDEPVPVELRRGAAMQPEIGQLVARCLAKSPDDRFASMDQLAAALRQQQETSREAPQPVTDGTEIVALPKIHSHEADTHNQVIGHEQETSESVDGQPRNFLVRPTGTGSHVIDEPTRPFTFEQQIRRGARRLWLFRKGTFAVVVCCVWIGFYARTCGFFTR